MMFAEAERRLRAKVRHALPKLDKMKKEESDSETETYSEDSSSEDEKESKNYPLNFGLVPTKSIHPQVAALLRRERYTFEADATQKLRSMCVTASDLGTIVHHTSLRGSNPFVSETLLLRKKLGLFPKTSNQAMLHGLYYELEALKTYERITGNVLVEEEVGFIKDASGKAYGATPDSVCKFLPILVETKCPYIRRPLPDKINDNHYAQLQWQMGITNIHLAHIVYFYPNTPDYSGQMKVFAVRFNPKWFKLARVHADKFLHQLIGMKTGSIPVPEIPSKKRKKLRAVPAFFEIPKKIKSST